MGEKMKIDQFLRRRVIIHWHTPAFVSRYYVNYTGVKTLLSFGRTSIVACVGKQPELVNKFSPSNKSGRFINVHKKKKKKKKKQETIEFRRKRERPTATGKEN